MKMQIPIVAFALIVSALCTLPATAQTTTAQTPTVQGADRRSRTVEWVVRDTLRHAKIYAPATSSAKEESPLVFVFHGRRGTTERVERKIPVHTLWEEAVVVYPQGLWTAGGVVGAGNGWVTPTAEDCGRDVEFFDEMLRWIEREYNIDRRRIYLLGHSNGGGFVCGLWSVRGDVPAAIAPVHSGAGRVAPEVFASRQPIPVFFAAATDDDIVRYGRVERTIFSTIELNGCSGEMRRIADDTTLYPSPDGFDVVTYIHTGGHTFPSDALPQIIKFFKSHRKAERCR